MQYHKYNKIIGFHQAHILYIINIEDLDVKLYNPERTF